MTSLSRRGFLGMAATAMAGALFGQRASAANAFMGVLAPRRSSGVSVETDLFEVDVLVVGSGPAGLSAAIAAARAGAKTAIVERYGFFGGVITQLMMGSISWYRYRDTIDAGGLHREYETRAKSMGATVDMYAAIVNTPLRRVFESMGLLVDGKPTYEILDTEVFKHVADTMLIEAGVRPLLHAHVVDTLVDSGVVRGVVVESKSGRARVLAKRVIDATGDADVACRAGAEFRQQPKDKLMEVTTNFSCSGVELSKFFAYQVWQYGKMKDWATTSGKEDEMFSTHLFKPFQQAKADGMIPADMDLRAFPGGFTPEGDILSMNAVHLWQIDPTNVMDLTRAEIEGRRQAMVAMQVLRQYVPGFANAKIRSLGHSIGTRDSRRVIGGYSMTWRDVTEEARFEDSIGICPEFIDGYGLLYLPTTGRYFQVPYRALVPEGVENLLVAGRSVGGDRLSHTATRQMVCCSLTGQAAGVAAALSAASGVSLRRHNVGAIQRTLLRQGVRVE